MHSVTQKSSGLPVKDNGGLDIIRETFVIEDYCVHINKLNEFMFFQSVE